MNIYQTLILIIAGAIAIRISLKFDLNKFLEERRKIRINQLKNICPHCKVEIDGKAIKIDSYFVSPFGTPNYVCSRCNLTVSSEVDVTRICNSYKKNPKKILKDEKRFIKQMKKLKLA